MTFDEGPFRCAGITVHPIVVDVAPSAKTGANATAKPVHLDASYLLPEGAEKDQT